MRAAIQSFASIACLFAASVGVGEEEGKSATYWVYSAQVQLSSHVPGEGIESFRSGASGNASTGGAVGLGSSIDDLDFQLTFQPVRRDNRFLLVTEIEREGEEPVREEHDLSDLKPMTIDLGVSKEGREHYAAVMPSAKKVEVRTKPFSVDALMLDQWQFSQSPVLVNDSLYVGRVGGGGEIVSLTISDIADVRFALREVEGWKPWGVLQNGTLTLTHPDDQTTIEIMNVRHGSGKGIKMPSGPYHIWVEWNPPSITSEEAHKQLKKIRDQVASGEILGNEYAIPYMDKQLARGPAPWLYGSMFTDRALMSP